jgi:galactokinase
MSIESIRARAIDAFAARFGARPLHMVQAPGRVNLIGEHTDYNDGFVLPCAIDRATVVVASPRNDDVVRVVAADFENEIDLFSVNNTIERSERGSWTHHVRGMVEQIRASGFPIRGLDMAIAGNVPQGAGLSSSASLEVSVGQAFVTCYKLDQLTPKQIAQLAQRAENEFVGCQCGIMDPLVSALGVAGNALLIDCRDLQSTPIPLPEGVVILIAHSMVARGLVDSEYNARRAACERVARHFGVVALRDLTLEELLSERSAGLDEILVRRARHVVTENSRTHDAVRALKSGDLQALGDLIAASHASMRDDFEITTPAIDELVEITSRAIGAYGGARMTGGGFGGCVVAVLPSEKLDSVCAAITQHYRSPSGESAKLFVCHASAGAGEI